MFNYLSPEDVNTFEEKYPEAASFLRRRSLIGERESLLNDVDSLSRYECAPCFKGSNDEKRLTWVRNRLNDLKECGFNG